jgi:hypothetical protein
MTRTFIVSLFLTWSSSVTAQSPVVRSSINKAVKNVTFTNFQERAQERWSSGYSANLYEIVRISGADFARRFQDAVDAEVGRFPMPRALGTDDARDILCGAFDQKNESPAFKGAQQFVRCELNSGYAYKKTDFDQFLDILGPNSFSSDPDFFETFEDPFLPNGFKSLLSVNVAPPSPKLFKAWLMSELMVFAQASSQTQLVTIGNSEVTYADKLIQAYLQREFLDRGNAILEDRDNRDGRSSFQRRLKFNTKTRSYTSGVDVSDTTGRVEGLNFALIFGGADQFNIGPGTFRFGGVVVDRSPFSASIGSWSFPIQLYYYFDAIETSRDELGYGLAEFYVDLFNPVGVLWLAWGEAFAYRGNDQIRSISYWTKILNY